MAWDHRYKPASGIPASGIAAGGVGWGGPSTGTRYAPLTSAGPGRGHVDPVRAEKRERMMAVLESIAENGQQESARVAAADKVLDRIDGKAPQIQIHDGRIESGNEDLLRRLPSDKLRLLREWIAEADAEAGDG